MIDEKRSDWQIPPFTAPPVDRYAWVEEQIKEGEGVLESQSCYKNLARNLKIFDGVIDDNSGSTLVTNGLKYDLRKFIEIISDVREIGTVRSDAPQFKPYAEMVNRVMKGVYIESQFPRQIRKALQYATVMGRGYIWPKCKAGGYGYEERRIVFEPLGLLDVVSVQVPSSNDVQEAYANTIYSYMPIAEAHGRFPLFQSLILPVRQVNYQSRLQCRRADMAERWRYGQQGRTWGSLYCEIRYTFIRDLRINSSRYELPMGDPGTSWFYKVPYVGQEIFGGIRGGQAFMRKATVEDCRIYPRLRLVITAAGMNTPMYDGPAFDNHGIMPPVQYDVDDWAWEQVGRSLVDDVGSIETTKRKTERKMDEVTRVTLNPPMGYDTSVTGGTRMENFDIFGQDIRMGADGEPKKIIQSILPDEVRVVGEHFKMLEHYDKSIEKQLGINDLGSLMNLKMNLSGDNLDKAIEGVGPIAKGIAGLMEAANAKIAYMTAPMIPQWFTTPRIIEYIGADNITPEVFDFDPQSIVPSHMPDEYVNDAVPQTPSQYSAQERIRRLSKNIRVVSVPSILLKITQKEEQLKFMSLKFKNAPISWETVFEKCGIEDYAVEHDKWVKEQIEEIKLKALAAKMAAELGLEPGGDKPGGGKGGRPSTNKKPMKQAQKGGAGGEPRVVNKTS